MEHRWRVKRKRAIDCEVQRTASLNSQNDRGCWKIRLIKWVRFLKIDERNTRPNNIAYNRIKRKGLGELNISAENKWA